MKKVDQQQDKQTKPSLFSAIELKIDKQSDFKKRLISSIFLFIFMVVYVGLSVIYQQGSWKGLANADVASYFNFAISIILVGACAYELLKAMGVHKSQYGLWFMVGGIAMAVILFFYPWNNNHVWALYSVKVMNIVNWNEWYIIFLINILAVAVFGLIAYYSTKSWKNVFMLIIYMYVVVMGFKGFTTIALTMDSSSTNKNSPTWVFGWNTIIWVWGTIILTDTFAYLGGRKFGKTKLAPTISPKKTWEGSGIGSLVAVISGVLYAVLFFYLKQDYSPFFKAMNFVYQDRGHAVPGVLLALITILISFAGQIGDLFFSWYKRVYKIKDFSKLIPGHGGILDRMDSFLFVFFILYFITIASN